MEIPKFVDETGEEVPKKKSRLTSETWSVAKKYPSVVEKHVSLPAHKSLTISEPVNEISLVKLNPVGSHISSISFHSQGFLMFLYCFIT
jgi:hypothetical protein